MIWGIDSSSKSVALVGHDGYVVQAHKLTVPKSDRGRELSSLREQVERVLSTDENPIVFVEASIKVRGMQTAIMLAQTVGMLLSLPVPTYPVPIDSWKKHTVGKGGASKTDVAQWLQKAHPDLYSLCGSDQDLVDAAAVCIYGSAVSSRSLDLSGLSHQES